jgi:hypothetical protein
MRKVCQRAMPCLGATSVKDTRAESAGGSGLPTLVMWVYCVCVLQGRVQ